MHLKSFLLGALTVLGLPVLGVAWLTPLLTGGGVLAEASRIAEGATLLLLLTNLGIALMMALLRAPRLALALAGATLGATLTTGLRVAPLTAPLMPRASPALNLVWWNAYGGNPLPAPRLAGAVTGFDADVVILGEARALKPSMAALRQSYPYNLGCQPDDLCDVVVLSRKPLQSAGDLFGRPYLGSTGLIRNQRLAVFRVDTRQGPLNIVAMHQSKPWYGAVHGVETGWLYRILANLDGPTVMVGDFNTPPWGNVMVDLARTTGLRLPANFRPTWPIGLGPLGVPIDHVLVRGGARLTGLASIAGDLGSNHRGLRAGVALEDAIAGGS